MSILDSIKNLLAVQQTQNTQQSAQTQQASESEASVFVTQNRYSATINYDRTQENNGDEDANVNNAPFNSEEGIKGFVGAQFGENLTDNQRYAAELGILNQNRNNEDLTNAINEFYLTGQMVQILTDNGVDVTELSEEEQYFFADLINGAKTEEDIDNLSVSPETKKAFKEVLAKIQNGDFDQYDFSDPNFDVKVIPQEIIEGATYPSTIETLNYETISTLKPGEVKNADGLISTDVEFMPGGENVKKDPNTGEATEIDFSDCKTADDYAEIIADAYGLKDTNGDGKVDLTSEAASVILEGLVRSNPALFKGLDLTNATNQDVLDFMAENNITSLFPPIIALSSTDANKTRDSYLKEGNEIRTTQLHTSAPEAVIGEDINTGVDILEYVEYGDTTLKDALQDAIIAQDLGLLSSDEFEGMSYDKVLEICSEKVMSGEDPDGQYVELYNNLTLLSDRFKDCDDLATAIKEAQEQIGEVQESSAALKELAATALRQEFDNNPIFGNYFQDGNDDNIYRLLNADLGKIISEAKADGQDADMTFKLEDVNYVIERKKVIVAQPPQQPIETPPEPPEPPEEPEDCEENPTTEESDPDDETDHNGTGSTENVDYTTIIENPDGANTGGQQAEPPQEQPTEPSGGTGSGGTGAADTGADFSGDEGSGNTGGNTGGGADGGNTGGELDNGAPEGNGSSTQQQTDSGCEATEEGSRTNENGIIPIEE